MTTGTDHDALLILHGEIKRLLEVLPGVTNRLEEVTRKTEENCADIRWLKVLLAGTWTSIVTALGVEWIWKK